MSSNWIAQDAALLAPQRSSTGGHTDEHTSAKAAKTDRALRWMDKLLAALALALLALPFWWARRIGKVERISMVGQGGKRFERQQLELPENRAGRLLSGFGAAGWPVLMNIWRGQMAWVGPTPTRHWTTAADPRQRVRPGLISLWEIRRRTAVDFGTEHEATLEYLSRRGLKHDLSLLARGALVMLLASPSVAAPGRVRICDVEFDNVNMSEALGRIEQMLAGSQTCQVAFVNPACVNIAAGNRGYRRSLARAAFVLPDGIGTKIAGDMLGTPLKQNVNGTDLFPRLCDVLHARGSSLYLLGGQPGIPEKVAQSIQDKWPGIRIAGSQHGFFSAAEEGSVAAAIKASGADFLLVARGVPSQDVFIDRYLHHFGVKVAMGVGGLFDFVAGRIQRAPRWMRDIGMEWVWRLLQEPTRMWKRYLVGNFTFLGRVALQRLRLRHPADDRLSEVEYSPEPAPALALGPATAVLFATATAGADMPVDSDSPACLLPLGPTSFIEQAVAQLAQAGVRQIHIVSSAQPEALRQALGEGARWGVELRWHLVKGPRSAAAAMRNMRLAPEQRIVLGMAHRWIDLLAIQRLVDTDLALDRSTADGSPQWLGWASLSAQAAETLFNCEDLDSMNTVLHYQGLARAYLDNARHASADNADALLKAQEASHTHDFGLCLTDVWIKKPWGYLSPKARVSEQADIQGPAWIGPGSLVDAGAQIGAGVVLTRNVLVGQGASLQDVVVMPATMIGQGINLNSCIVRGGDVQNVRLNVRTSMPAREALVATLGPSLERSAPLMGRALALPLAAALAPFALAQLVLNQLGLSRDASRAGRSWALPWTRDVVQNGGRTAEGVRLEGLVRTPRAGLSGAARLGGAFGPVLDIVGGHRQWWGVRPRPAAQWHALDPDWQAQLLRAPIGWLHAPAWVDAESCPIEATAAADLAWLAEPSLRRRLRTMHLALRQAWQVEADAPRLPSPQQAQPALKATSAMASVQTPQPT